MTAAFLAYARPLVGADMPEVAQLRAPKVAKAGVLIGDAT